MAARTISVPQNAVSHFRENTEFPQSVDVLTEGERNQADTSK